MQNGADKSNSKIFKRSLSGGRDYSDTKPDLIKDVFDVPNQYRHSFNKANYESPLDKDLGSSSRCSVDDFSRSLRSSYSSDTSDKYKLYSSESGNQIYDNYPTLRYYETLPARSSCVSPTTGRPPISGSGYLSPPPLPPDASTIRRRSSHRRISRFLRPDFYDTPREDSIYADKIRESESTRILRDIRERSRERSSDRNRTASSDRLNYLNEKYSKDNRKSCMPDIQNHLISCPQYNPELIANTLENIKTRRRSLSRSREAQEEESNRNQAVNNNVLAELQLLSQPKSIEKSNKKSHSEKEENGKIINSDMVTKLTNQIESVSLLNETKPKEKKESKLVRPKSYPSKDQERKISPDKTDTKENEADVNNNPKEATPKSKLFQPSKITPPKEVIKKSIQSRDEEAPRNEKKSSSKSPLKSDGTESKPKTIVKVSKKSPPKGTTEGTANEKPEKKNIPVKTEKSPEKTLKKGFLHSISQKFEKFKEKSKDRKSQTPSDKNNNVVEAKPEESNIKTDNLEPSNLTKLAKSKSREIPKKSNVVVTEENGNDVSVIVVLKKKVKDKDKEKETPSKDNAEKVELAPPINLKLDKKSKIDDMIRNLRERSVPRGPQLTESHLIKRAVSVEEMPGTFNKRSVNKVLGLFKKIEKENTDRKIQSTKSSIVLSAPPEQSKERPKSSGFVSKLKKTYPYVGAKSDSILTITEQDQHKLDKMNGNISRIPTNKNCPDCRKEDSDLIVTKRELKQSKEDKDRIKNNRKGLMLDLSQPIVEPKSSKNTPSSIYSPTTPMSSDYKRSTFDDCGASSSTFLSPTEDNELCFDNWSVCSEDRYNDIASSSSIRPLSSTTHPEYDSENILDRIRRKSFYTRFNEKKPKRVSSIVGPGANKEYYGRDSISRATPKPPEYRKSPTANMPETTKQESYRPPRASVKPVENGLTNGYRLSTIDYLNNNKDYQLPPSNPSSSSSSRRSDDLKKYSDLTAKAPRIPITTSSSRSNALLYSLDNSSNSSIYGTYNPKRRISYNNGQINSSLPEATSYATLGRKPKSYDQRTVSLLEGSRRTDSTTRPSIDYGHLRTSYKVPSSTSSSSSSALPPRNKTNI